MKPHEMGLVPAPSAGREDQQRSPEEIRRERDKLQKQIESPRPSFRDDIIKAFREVQARSRLEALEWVLGSDEAGRGWAEKERVCDD